MTCTIHKDSFNNIVEVLTPQGDISQLFSKAAAQPVFSTQEEAITMVTALELATGRLSPNPIHRYEGSGEPKLYYKTPQGVTESYREAISKSQDSTITLGFLQHDGGFFEVVQSEINLDSSTPVGTINNAILNNQIQENKVFDGSKYVYRGEGESIMEASTNINNVFSLVDEVKWEGYEVLSGGLLGQIQSKQELPEIKSEEQSPLSKSLLGDVKASSLSPELIEYMRVHKEELAKIKEEAIKDGSFLKAPNGNKSNLDENLWLETRHPNFINWFGDFINNAESASKAVDKNGDPIVVYHGSEKSGFNEFSITDVRDGGHFFSSNVSIAKTYTSRNDYRDMSPVTTVEEAIQRVEENDGYVVQRHYIGDTWFETPEQALHYVSGSTLNDIKSEYEIWGNDEDLLIETDDLVSGVNSAEIMSPSYSGFFLNTRDPLYVEGNGNNWDDIRGGKSEDLNLYLRYNEETDSFDFQDFDGSITSKNDFIEIYQHIEETHDDAIAEQLKDDYEEYGEGNYMYNGDPNTGEIAPWGQSTREWVRNANDYEADGVIFEDIDDNGPYGNSGTGDVYVVFDSENIKSTENIGQFSPKTGDIRFSIVGKKGALALDQAQEVSTRIDNLEIAQSMLDKGVPAKDVKVATGWEVGADGNFKYEINYGNIIPEGYEKMKLKGFAYPLNEIYDNKELFDSYPNLKDVQVMKVLLPGGTIASFRDSESGWIVMNTNLISEDEVLPILLHEIQHIIQKEEGFAKGGNPDITKMAGFQKYFKESDNIQGLTEDDRFLIYKQLMGEVEARNVEKRSSMGIEERLNSLLESTEDISREDQRYLEEAISELNKSEKESNKISNLGAASSFISQTELGVLVPEIGTQTNPESSINIKSLKERTGIEGEVPVVTMKDFEGIPMTFSISDELTTGDITNPYTGNIIDNLYGGLGFNINQVHKDYHWANIDRTGAENQLKIATNIYNVNKELFDTLWEEGKLPNGLVPVAIVKMSATAIDSNESVLRVAYDSLKSFKPFNLKKNQKKLIAALLNDLTPGSNLYDHISENNYNSIDEIIGDVLRHSDSNGKQYSLKDISMLSGVLLNSGSKSKFRSTLKELGFTTPLTKVGVRNILKDPAFENVGTRDIISISGIDVLNPQVKETKHPNYPWGLNGSLIGVLENPVNAVDVFATFKGSVIQQLKSNTNVTKALSQGIPTSMGLTNISFRGDMVSNNMTEEEVLAGYLRQAFPGVNFTMTQASWDFAINRPEVKKFMGKNGEVEGFTDGKSVFINPKYVSNRVLLHEAGHIWGGYMRKESPELWNRGLSLTEGTQELEDAKKIYGDTELAREEALMELISNKGSKILDETKKSKFEQWLLDAWAFITSQFKSSSDLIKDRDIQTITLDEFIGAALVDMLSGESIDQSMGNYASIMQPPKGKKGDKSGTGTLFSTTKYSVRGEEWYNETTSSLPNSKFKSEQELKDFLDNGNWGMLTGENPEAKALGEEENANLNRQAVEWLNKRNYDFVEIVGSYDGLEKSFFVENLTPQDAVKFANKFSQDSVATNKGLIYQNKTFNPNMDDTQVGVKKDDFFSTIKINNKPIKFAVEYDFNKVNEMEGMNDTTLPISIVRDVINQLEIKSEIDRNCSI